MWLGGIMELLIETSDSYGEKSSEKVQCTKENTEKGIKYSYKNELGDSKIFILEDRVQIMRKGTITSNQILKLNEDTTFKYRTPYLIKNFILKTASLDKKDNGVELVYSLYEENEKINEIKLTIREV